jgi:hypothetical protein
MLGSSPLTLAHGGAIGAAAPFALHEPKRARPLGLAFADPASSAFEGLPRGAVTEIVSAAGLGGATRLALAVCAAAQAEACVHGGEVVLRDEDAVWCAWIDASATLYAPGAVSAGVDPTRLLVVRPPERTAAELVRTAVRVVASRLFAVVVVDRSGVPGAALACPGMPAPRRAARWSVAARRLALAAEGGPTSVLLMSSSAQAEAEPLPVALRLEVERRQQAGRQEGRERAHLCLRVLRDRSGRSSSPFSLLPASPASMQLAG